MPGSSTANGHPILLIIGSAKRDAGRDCLIRGYTPARFAATFYLAKTFANLVRQRTCDGAALRCPFLLVGIHTPAHQTNGFPGFALRLRGGNYAGARAYTYFDGCDYTINHAPHSRHSHRRRRHLRRIFIEAQPLGYAR